MRWKRCREQVQWIQELCKCTRRVRVEIIPPFAHSGATRSGSAYPADSPSPVFSVICAQDFEEDVGVGAVIGELQETGEAAHPKLWGKTKENTNLTTLNLFSWYLLSYTAV